MNRVHRRLSRIKGGGLGLAAQPARLVTLAISDIPGDDPAAIAPGPTVPALDGSVDLSGVVARLGPELPSEARALLLADEAPAPDYEADVRLIATPQRSLEAAAAVARAAGVTPVLLGDALEADAQELGKVMAGIAASVRRHAAPAGAPAVLLSGGEASVTIGQERPGRGGRNTEFLLSLALALDGTPRISALAADTDGIDGTEDAAGALIGPDILTRATAAGLDPRQMLVAHDSYSLFDACDALIKTGPTLTDVNDFRAILIL